jgi:hypothetical protein
VGLEKNNLLIPGTPPKTPRIAARIDTQMAKEPLKLLYFITFLKN